METTQEICHICNAYKILKPAGASRVTGKPYEAFLACPNFKNHKKVEPKQEAMPAFDVQILADELVGINRRLDGLAEYLKNHLEEKKTN